MKNILLSLIHATWGGKSMRYYLVPLLIAILLSPGLYGFATAKVVVIERIHVMYLKNSIVEPGWHRGFKDLDKKAFENMVRSTLVNHATKVFESAGYTILVGQEGRSFQDDLLILSMSASVKRAFVKPCLPGKKSDSCLPGVDQREIGGIWDPKKREFLFVNPVIAEKLEIACELKRKGTTEKVWSNHISTFPQDETGPIPVAKNDVDRLAEKIFEGFPIRKDVVLVPTYKELADAVFTGDMKKTKALLESGAPLETKSFDRTRPTLLMGAALNGHKEIAQILIKYGADIDAQAANDMTSLRLAAGNGHFGVVKVLLETGANVNPDATDNITPLYMAAQNGHADVVRLLLKYKAIVDQKASSGSTPLFAAAQEGYIEIFEMLVKKGADVRVRRDDGVPIWIPVAQQGRVDIMKALIKMGVNVVKRDEESGLSALYMAAQGAPHGTNDRQAYRELVTLLLNEGADIDKQIVENMTPLLVAIQEQNFDITSILIERGVNVNLTRTGGISALMMASYHGHANTVKKLLANKADIGAKDSRGQTAMDYALVNDHGDIVKILKGSQK